MDKSIPIPDEYLTTIIKVCQETARKFKFGTFLIEDIEQQLILKCIEVIREGKYNPELPLENFLRIHARNRAFNFKRDNGHRNEAPCKSCPLWDKKQKTCIEYGLDRMQCPLYSKWSKKVQVKKNVMSPTSLVGLENVLNVNSGELGDDTKAFLNYVDEQLGFEFRENYLKCRAGIKINKYEEESLMGELKRIGAQWENSN